MVLADALIEPVNVNALPNVRWICAGGSESDREAFESSCFEGATYWPLDGVLSTVQSGHPLSSRPGGRHPLPAIADWCAFLRSKNLSQQSTVVLYDFQNAAMAASRAWWMLRAAGVAQAYVLNGKIVDVKNRRTEHLSMPAQSAWPTRWQRPIADIEQVDAARTDHDWRVIDVRSRERFEGKAEPLDKIAGHIPGAFNIPYTDNLDSGGHFKSHDILRQLYFDILQHRESARWIVHCGSGVTACHTLLALEHAGLLGASLYVGSWGEWCVSGKPIATAL